MNKRGRQDHQICLAEEDSTYAHTCAWSPKTNMFYPHTSKFANTARNSLIQERQSFHMH